jgi:hypothetical protein
MRSIKLLVMSAVLAALGAGAQWAADPDYHGLDSIVLESDVLRLQILTTGGPFVDFTLRDDPERLSPMWAPLRAAAEAGRKVQAGGFVGHFVCVDGFGPVSAEEREAGLMMHGEAYTLPWTTVSRTKEAGVTSLTQTVELPLAHESLSRTVKLADGENVVYVHSVLTNQLAFDRPINWAEHATIGSPFLERGVTVVDMSPNRAITRPYDSSARGSLRRTLVSGEEFEWPLAPTKQGEKIDLRAAPTPAVSSLDHTGHLMTPAGEKAWVTALHPGKRLLIGYIYNTAEFPWMQTWQSYAAEGMMSRGLEFGTQTFDVSRREAISEGKRFDAPLFRWLPAKSAIEASYLMFLVRTPEGFTGVSDVRLANGSITIRDAKSNQVISLAASLAN